MARIDALPSIEIIRGLKGILDFYVWRGLPCVRAWPHYRPTKQTAASLAAALVFGAIVKSYSLLANTALEAYRQDALDQPRTARDIMVTGVYGNLHEASMSDFLDLLVECRDFLSTLTALLNALDSVDTDELVVNVDQTVLPPTAATDAHQLTQITALQTIDDLQDALESKALDRLLVRGSNQLFSLKDVLFTGTTAALPGPDSRIESIPVPAGLYWIVTNVVAWNATAPMTEFRFAVRHGATTYEIGNDRQAFAIDQRGQWQGHTFLDVNDEIWVYFRGAAGGDTCTIKVSGYRLTVET